ncbi:hypothetical protein DFH08DRAFT_390226 [Mycena albidolilacea]|uniref:Uncharacterized protein n=1 Tax=Mycena albidolilacea TaxID=1033008 RepID=A0AAD6ZEH3_9AGAR|nr:hypothetical protein DFH08DRAFT_390226 [Mycena albidolilacea]
MAGAHVSNALVPYYPNSNRDVVKTQEIVGPQGAWALIRTAVLNPTPGRTLHELYMSVGKAVEKHANRAAHGLGLGPHAVAQKIKSYFGDGEERLQKLGLLRTSIPLKLAKHCEKLMKYTLPTESANTQCQAFRVIVELVTLFPGLRMNFVRARCMGGATSIDAICMLWSRPTTSPDEEWVFWNALAATSLSDSTLSTILEDCSIAQLISCDDGRLSISERLLIEHHCSGSNICSALCVRYLVGLLDLARFWLDMSDVKFAVARKLCFEMVRILEDIGVDILELGPIAEWQTPFDYDGVDSLAITLLNGFAIWFSKLEPDIWAIQPWYESFRKFLQILRRPRSAELLPNSSDCAMKGFNNIVPAVYQDVELQVAMDSAEGTPSAKNTVKMDLNCSNNSMSSLQSNIQEPQDPDEQAGSVHESQSGDSHSLASDTEAVESEQEIEEDISSQDSGDKTQRVASGAESHTPDSDARNLQYETEEDISLQSDKGNNITAEMDNDDNSEFDMELDLESKADAGDSRNIYRDVVSANINYTIHNDFSG